MAHPGSDVVTAVNTAQPHLCLMRLKIMNVTVLLRSFSDYSDELAQWLR